ncbi:efflux RND transporter permease subunit [Thioflexithrix psekupsensis]|uniref:Acriflavin resistance protein n=1 Tax=Thioflexithrix psekupsensis TaxID=1570016 RepID=A0A251X630_9GAMM|nr:efflux RND transporter permease subunit [Thioflexithrix psekupsensis]OUD13082.1 acriflavin resistance protein [Thioflexithrix psekupsensis]
MTEKHSQPPEQERTAEASHLGIAGRMARDYIHSPLSPLFFVAMLFMGIMGLIFTPRQEDPQISVPMVDLFIQYPGASSQQVSSLALDPLQRIMAEIPGVKHVYSAAMRGQGMVTVQFDVGEQMENSVFKVHDKLQSNLDKVPPGVMPPLVKPKGIDDVAVVALTLWSEDVDDGVLRTIALDVMQSLKEIADTGASYIVGGRAEQVKIEVMPERLSGFNISLAQVAQTIQTANSQLNAGYLEMDNRYFTVYTGSFLQSADDVAQLVVGTHANAPVYVRDVATVTQGPEEARQLVNFFSGSSYPQVAGTTSVVNGAAAVTIAVAKKVGTNGVSVADQVLKQVEMLQQRLIPDNVHVEVTRNYGKTANDKVNDLIKKLFIATGAVTVLVLLTLGIRPAIVVTLVIPVVILITVFSAWVLGFTIDRVSLFALIFSIGILVDDAIVVVENIYRRWLLNGKIDTDTAVDAVREVGNPTILATFTVVAALLPMGFVSGMMGPYMAPIPALGSVAMIFSLLAAFMFTPWLAMRIRPSIAGLHAAEQREHNTNEKLERFYRWLLPPLFSNRLIGWGFLLGLVLLFFAACAMFYTTAVQVKMLPLDNKPEYSVFLNMPEGTSLPATANLTYQMVEKIRSIPEVVSLVTYIGTSQPFDFNGMVRHYYLRDSSWQADIHIQLMDKKDRKRSSHQIATETRRMLAELTRGTGARFTVVEMPPGPPVLQAVVAEVYGPDNQTRRTVAQHLTHVFEQSEIVSDVDNYMDQPYDTWHFVVDTEKAVRRGISVDTINQNLAMALGGFKLGDIKRGTVLEPTYIVIQVPLSVRSQLTRLYDLPMPSQQGSSISLAELGRFVKVPQDPIIYQKDLRPVEYVVGDSVGTYLGDNRYRLGAPIYGMFEVERLLQGYVTPDGVDLGATGGYYLGPPPADGRSGFEWTGEWTITYETFRDMGLAFGVAMVLIYILVVWLFGNFLVPAVIMAPIPLTLLGIIPGHWLLNAEFTATSMIGWIALAGIIVRNSILLVDYSIHEVKKGTPIEDAVILACKTRTRPIMITAFALVAGSFVILFDPIFQGMAISLLFGVLVSTLLTLVVIPLGCISVGPEALCSSGLGGDESNCGGNNTPHDGGSGGQSKTTDSDNPGFFAQVGEKVVLFATLGFYMVRAVFIMLWMMIVGLWTRLTQKPEPPPPPRTVQQPPTPVTPTPPPAAPVTTAPSPAVPPVVSSVSVVPAHAMSGQSVVQVVLPADKVSPETVIIPVTLPEGISVESTATPIIRDETPSASPAPELEKTPTPEATAEIAEVSLSRVDPVESETTPAPSSAPTAQDAVARSGKKSTNPRKQGGRRGIQLKTDLTDNEDADKSDKSEK